MIIAVTGFRGYTDVEFIGECLDVYDYMSHKLGNPLHVRVGDAAGADWITRKWCEKNKVSLHVFYADWEHLARRAGPERNERMLKGEGDHITGPTQILVAFPATDGMPIRVPGSGTFGCVIRAHQLGIRVEIPAYNKGVPLWV